MDKLHNNKRYREYNLGNDNFVISGSLTNSNNNNTYLFSKLLCNYDVIEKNPLLHAHSYDVKL